MAITTYTLSGTAFTSDGSAIANAVITAKLNKPDYTSDGSHLPRLQKTTADSNGDWSLDLVSNLDGTQDSRYMIEIRLSESGGLVARETIQMPQANTTLAQLVDQHPVTTEYSTAAALSAAEAEAAKGETQVLRDETQGLRDQSEGFRDQSQAAASASSNSADLSEAWATGTTPGGAGTKSSREWAEDSEASKEGADQAKTDIENLFEDRTTPIAVSGTSIDLSQAGVYYKLTLDGSVTLTFDNPQANINAFTLEVDHLSGEITWPASVVWPFGTAPSYNSGNKHLFMFVSSDGGTTYRGSALVDYSS